MKIFHLSDLHIGKMWKQVSMLEDQRYIFRRILAEVEREHPDAVLICGDIYDRSMPSEEAVSLFDWLLTSLHQLSTTVMIIAGNHDSDQRLSCGSRVMSGSGIHISQQYAGSVERVVLSDAYGRVVFHLLPFVQPRTVAFHLEEEVKSYTDALQAVVDTMPINADDRNVLLCHQYLTGSEMSDSDEQTLGGLDNVDACVFAPFDYVALGHLHRPQSVGGNAMIRYCGTPLCYSFSECGDAKSITVVEMGPKGEQSVRTIPLVPLHKVYDLRGSYEDLTSLSFYDATDYRESYVRITLTDANDIPDGEQKLRLIYHNMLEMGYDNERTRRDGDDAPSARQLKTPLQYITDLYEQQNGAPMQPEQQAYMQTLIEDLFD